MENVQPNIKVCNKCKASKPKDQFHDKRAQCKTCRSLYNTEYQEKLRLKKLLEEMGVTSNPLPVDASQTEATSTREAENKAAEVEQQLDELVSENERLKRDLQLAQTKYITQSGLLMMAQNDLKESEKKHREFKHQDEEILELKVLIDKKHRELKFQEEEITRLNTQVGSMFDQKEALEISTRQTKRETDELIEKLRQDLRLEEEKYNGQTALLKMARDEMKALEEEFQIEIQDISAENERKINQLRVEVADIKDEVLMHEKTISQVTLQLKEKDEKIKLLQDKSQPAGDRQAELITEIQRLQQDKNALVLGNGRLQMELQQLKDQPRPPTAPQGIQKGLATLPNLAQIFNIKPEYKPDINTPPPTPPKTSSPGRPASFTHQRLPKTRECQDCLKDLPLDQFVKWHKRCRECEN